MTKPRQAYYDLASSWVQDREASAMRSGRIAWLIAACAVAVAMLEAVALMLLTPLKTVVPVTLLVDRQTGFVQSLDPVSPPPLGQREALTQSFLAQYVIARESFDGVTIGASYRKVALWSAGSARTAYLSAMGSTDPRNPLNLYPRSTVISTTIKSVSPLGSDAALIRFDTRRADRGAGEVLQGSWVAIIRYRYAGGPMRLEDRLVNPLGFQVLSYRRDAEVPPEAPATTALKRPGG